MTLREMPSALFRRRELGEGWELARGGADAGEGLGGLPAAGWAPAAVPGTVAGALGGAAQGRDLDADDWWYRLGFEAEPLGPGEEVWCRLDGVATVAEVYLNGEPLVESESMFAAHEVDVTGRLRAHNELIIRCRALVPLLAARRKPRARWRTRLVSDQNLRFHRTMLLGRAPGFAPGPPAVGVWRPVALEWRSGLALDEVRLRARISDDDGVVECAGRLRAIGSALLPTRVPVQVSRAGAVVTGELTVAAADETGRATVSGTVRVPSPERWWPHTHGAPALYDVTIGSPDAPLDRRRLGFRRLEPSANLLADGPRLHVNGVPIFARGAVWTPLDMGAPHAAPDRLREVLERVCSCGMNMLRVPGIATYESSAFHDLCDELGILVWQDFMFANLDYPEQLPEFMAAVEAEATHVLQELGARPSLAVICGGSEVAQQVAMLGLDPQLAEGPLYGELLPRLVREADVEAPYIPSAPWGGDLPFRPDAGVANYYGVGAYLRPLEDARRSEVRFAAECLAFANVPDEAALDDLAAPGGLAVHHPAWKAGVPRDAGAGWDFDDVRDHYLRLLFGVDPVALRWVDQERYLELSRAVSGEVMAEVFGEWRRAGSPCQGGLVLWLKDLQPGAGWGVLDHRGRPKVAYHHLRRALAPVAVWTTDEGLGGIIAHVANDTAEPLSAMLRVALYRDLEQLIDEAAEPVELPPGAQIRRNVETVLGRFVDAGWAYRFGPPAQDVVVASLELGSGDATRIVSQAFRFPTGRPTGRRPAAELGLTAALIGDEHGNPCLRVASRALAYGVRAHLPGVIASDDAFCLEPGHERLLSLRDEGAGQAADNGFVTAVNMTGRVRVSERA
jgi:beta-mannosidase